MQIYNIGILGFWCDYYSAFLPNNHCFFRSLLTRDSGTMSLTWETQSASYCGGCYRGCGNICLTIVVQSLSHVCLWPLTFTISWSLLKLRWPKYWSFSFSISSSNEYSHLISLQSKGLSRVFSSTTVQLSINSSVLSLLYGPTLTSIHDYCKNHSFDYINFVTKWCIWFLICCLGVS